jgi:predicted nucleotidyltransferase component of viral defense system
MNPDFEAREHFLILLLSELSRHLSGRPFALKGGVCLRLFYQSPRLSEDMDLDIAQVPTSALRNIVEKVLTKHSFTVLLESHGQKIVKWSASKQTPTTQRWKITLLVNNRLLNTKLEFSRRRGKIPFVSGIPDQALLSHYKIMAFVTQYYSVEEMITQKIAALGHPTRQAARDLFDLYYLINKKTGEKIRLSPTIILEAKEKCQAISLATFQNQVLPFLPEDLASFFAKLNNYQRLQAQIINYLNEWIKK